MSNFLIRTKLLVILLVSLYSSAFAQVKIISNTYTVCGETLVDIEIRETKANDFSNNDPKKQFVSIGFSNSNFKFKTSGYSVTFTLSGGGNGVSTTPTICPPVSCSDDDIDSDLFTFSYLMTNTEATTVIDTIRIKGLVVVKDGSASANATADIVRVDNSIDYSKLPAPGGMDAVINGSSIDDGKSLAHLVSPSVSLTCNKTFMCKGNNHLIFTTNLQSGTTYRLYEELSGTDADLGAVTPDASGNFSVSFLIGNTDTRKYYIKATKSSCEAYSSSVTLTVNNTSNFAMSADEYYCLGSKVLLVFTVDKINDVKYYLYIDQGGINPDILLQEVNPTFASGATTGTFEYKVPNTVTDGSEISYYVYTVPNSGTGCNRSSNYEAVKFKNTPSISSTFTISSPKAVISTAGSIKLNDLVTTSGANKVVFATTSGLSSSVLTVIGDLDTRLNPANIAAGTYGITAYAEDKSSQCRSNSITFYIRIVDGSNTLPYFLRNLDKMPICENMPGDKFKLYALISDQCISSSTTSITVKVEDASVPVGSSRTISATYNEGYDVVLGGVNYYGYEFEINPSLHRAFAIKVTFNISGTGCAYDGLIPINPRRDPRITGLPENLINVNDHYLCSSSNDSIFMRGNPVQGTYRFYKGVLQTGNTNSYDFSYLGSSISPSPAPENDKSLERFTPSHIFYDVLNGNGNSVIKVVYTTPELGDGTCPDSITKYLHFTPSVNVKFNVPAKLCYGETVEFNVVYDDAVTKDSPLQDKFYWNFDDGFSINFDTLSKQVHDYNAPGIYNMRFKTQLSTLPNNVCNFDTIQSIRIGAKPVVDYLVYKNFIDSTTIFNSTSAIKVPSRSDKPGDVDSLYSWEYKFGTPANDHYLSHYQGDTVFVFPSQVMKEPYKVTHIVTAKYGCADSVSHYIPVFPIKKPGLLNFSLDTFNITDNNGWFHSGQYDPKNISSWRNAVPKGTIIKEDGKGGAWLTLESDESKANYNSEESSWVESPVYNLSDLDLPMVSLDNIVNTDLNFDGVALQYAFCDTSAFGKEEWNTLGNETDGINWYNSKFIFGLPQSQFYGWTGKTQESWQSSAYNLDQIKAAFAPSKKLIRFRLLLGTNKGNDLEYPYFEGFAFDNFFIGQRNRKIVIEEFCDYQKNDIGDIKDQKLPFDTIQGYYIQYHTGLFTNKDKIYNQNPDEPSARALHYGLGKYLPRGVIDGIFYNNNDSLSKWGPKEYIKRSLRVSPFEMSGTVNINSSKDSLIITTVIDKTNDSFKNRNLLLHVAVVEKSVEGNDGVFFTNVLRNMIPNAAGTRIDKTEDWTLNKQYTCSWKPFIAPASDFTIISYIQDEDTKEIYQAFKVNVPLSVVASLSKNKFGNVNENSVSFNEMTIQPNPIENDLKVVFNGILKSDYDWIITDSYGRIVSDGTLSGGINAAFIETYNLTPGIYHLTLKGEGRAMIQKFVVIK